MKKRILEILEDHRGFEDLEYVAGLIEHVIKEKTNGEKIAEFTPEGVDYSKLSDESTRLSGIEYSEFAELSFGNDGITHDGDGKKLNEDIQWKCKICDEDTSQVDYDYIGGGTNHLSCELKAEQRIEEKDNDYSYGDDYYGVKQRRVKSYGFFKNEYYDD